MKLFTVIALLLTSFVMASAQIEIDGDMLDWAGVPALDQDPANELTGDVAAYPDFDLMDLYITHDTANVYVRIDLNPAANFRNFYNYSNPPVFEFYMSTEIGDTTGFDWGWWNVAMKYYVNLALGLHPDSTNRTAELYVYNGTRMPTWAEGEFVLLEKTPLAINGDANAVEFSIPRRLVNFGSEFRPWIYSVGDFQWDAGADMMPGTSDEYMLKYDFFYGGSVYRHHGPQVDSDIQIDGDMLDWATITAADMDEISEDIGDMTTGVDFDVKDVYATSDSFFLYLRVDIDPAGSFAGMYNKYVERPVFQLFLDVNWGDTTGLGYGGFWKLPPEYMIDLSAALHPDSTANLIPVWHYVADWMGAYEEFAALDGQFASFAKNGDDNVVEIAIPREAINADTDVRPWLYVVGNQVWDMEEYWPNSVHQGWSAEIPEKYYAYNYNYIAGGSAHQLGDNSVTAIEDQPAVTSVKGFGLVRNYPNPFNPKTNIQFSLGKSEMVSVHVFDVLGRHVRTLLSNQRLSAGAQSVEWNGTDSNHQPVTSGLYFYTISSSEGKITRKMALIK
jgi:hypothetical protein